MIARIGRNRVHALFVLFQMSYAKLHFEHTIAAHPQTWMIFLSFFSFPSSPHLVNPFVYSCFCLYPVFISYPSATTCLPSRCRRFLLNDAGDGRQDSNMAKPMACKSQHGQHETFSYSWKWKGRTGSEVVEGWGMRGERQKRAKR